VTRRRLGWLLVMLVPLVGLAGGSAWLLGTQAGLDWALATAVTRSAGRLELGAARGTLGGRLEFDDLRLQVGSSLRLEIAHAELSWRPWLLVLGKLDVTQVTARGVRATVTPDPDAPPFVLPARLPLPMHIVVADLRVTDAELHLPGLPPLLLDSLSARAGADTRGLWLEDLVTRGPPGALSGALRMQAAQPYAVEGRFGIELLSTPQAVHADLGVTGRLEDLRVTGRSSAPVMTSFEANLSAPFASRDLVLTARASALAVQRLWPDLPPVTLDADLRLAGSLRDATGLALGGTVDARLPGRPGLHSEFEARLAPGLLTIEQARLALAGQPGRATLRGTLALATQHIDTALVWQDLGLRQDGGVLSLSPQGRLAISGDPETLRFSGAAAGPGAPAESLVFSGEFAPRSRALTLRAEWPTLALPGVATSEFTLGAGTLGITGRSDAPRFELATAATLRDQPAAQLSATGALTDAALRVESFRVAWLASVTTGAASLGLDARRELTIAARVRDLDPGALHPDWPGAVDARVDLAARLGTEPQALLRVSEMGGRLRGQALGGRSSGGQVHVQWRPGQIEVPLLDLTLGSARLSGSWSRAEGATWDLAVPELHLLWPEARGSVLSAGSARGTLAAPELEFTLDATALAWRTQRIARLQGASTGSAEARSLRLTGSGLRLAGQRIDSLDLELAGGAAAHRGQLVIAGALGRFDAALDGGWDAGRWQGRLTRASLAVAGLDTWRLDSPAPLDATRTGFSVPRTCWSAGAARACLDAAGDAESWRIAAELQGLALASLAPLLPDGLAYGGQFDGRVWLRGGAAPLAGLAELTLSAGQVSQQRAEQRVELLGYRSGTARVALADGALEARLALALEHDGSLLAELDTRTDGVAEARPLRGRVRIATREFALVPVLLPELRRFSGQLDADLSLGGTLGTPTFSGRADFSAGTAAVPRLGLEVDQLRVSLRGAGEALEFEGSARAGGVLEWQGRVQRAAHGWDGRLSLKGAGFRAANLPEAQVTISPDLELKLTGHDLGVTGTLRVPQARLAPRDLEGAVPVSADQVVIRSETSGPAPATWRISTRLRLVLGDDVRFDGFGLRARVTGELVATDTPDQLTLGSGELSVVEGQYTAYGQQMTIERGRLLFTGGPVTDPGMDVRATRLVERGLDGEDVTVGVNIRGTLRRPLTTLFAQSSADRVLSEAQMLSLLVLGHALDTGDSEDAEQLDQARQNLGFTTGGAFLARTLGRQIGIEDVTIRNSGYEDAQLVLGKYLSPRLYVSYGIGLFEPTNTVRVRYQLGSKWSVEAESGQENAADFKYTIEK
jgi:translocation and assembly module TamB